MYNLVKYRAGVSQEQTAAWSAYLDWCAAEVRRPLSYDAFMTKMAGRLDAPADGQRASIDFSEVHGVRKSPGSYSYRVAPGDGRSLVAPRRELEPAPQSGGVSPVLDDRGRQLLAVLAEYGVRGSIIGVETGHVVTSYLFAPARGVKEAEVTKLAPDIARGMKAKTVRVSGASERGAIAIEVPNAKRQIVELGDVLAHPECNLSRYSLPLVIGVDAFGAPAVHDLQKMPHLLIAGTTGSGKSMGINAMIMSLLNRLTPAQCRFIMIDPKMLELTPYDGIPHLLVPVVTDMSKAIVALNWAVREMDQRFAAMTSQRVRGLTEYNARMLEPDRLPRIVVIIDEFADMMLTTGKDVEIAVQRLAQKARAAGIHLIMATQRPDANVVTPVIRANFPTRLSYNVANRHDAGVINLPGAENLLGRGDLLFQLGGGRIIRAHGPYVSSSYVCGVVESLKSNSGEADYIDLGGDENDEEDGPVFDQGGIAERADVGARRGDKMDYAALWIKSTLAEAGRTLAKDMSIIAASEEPPIARSTLFKAADRLADQGVLKKIPAGDKGNWTVGDGHYWELGGG
jgi:DNA segregation ATPase FtsK/SpoIIIE-like protein